MTDWPVIAKPLHDPARATSHIEGQAGGRCGEIAAADGEQGARGNVKLVPGAHPQAPTPQRPVEPRSSLVKRPRGALAYLVAQ